jgi:hypothetical protein
MQIVPCRGCSSPVSVEALACPHCGQPTMLGKQKRSTLAVVLIVGVGTLVFYGMFFDVCRR